MLKVAIPSPIPAEADCGRWCKRAGSPALRDFPSEPSEIYCFTRKCIFEFRVRVGACAVRPQSLKCRGRGGRGSNHRLHTLKPTDSIPWSIYRSNPISVFSQFHPTGQLAGSRTAISPSIYPFTSPPTSILPSILLHMTYGTSLPITLCQTLTICVWSTHLPFPCRADLGRLWLKLLSALIPLVFI